MLEFACPKCNPTNDEMVDYYDADGDQINVDGDKLNSGGVSRPDER